MKYSNIFQQKFSSWSELEKVIEALPTTKQRGDAFEEFIFVYLNLKKQLYQVKDVFMSSDIPANHLTKYKIEKKDSGVDGLIIREDNKAAAYQVKFRTNRVKPKYDELAKFWVEGKHTDFNYTIANCYSVTDLSQKNDKHLQILVDEFDLLDENFFEEFFAFVNEKKIKEKKQHIPHDFQKEIIKDVAFRYKQEDSENVMTFDINSYQYAVEGIQLPETVLLKETDGREDSTNADAILEYIDEKSKSQIGGCYLKDLTEHFVTGKIISRATLFNCLEKLQKDGKISKPSKGQYKSTQ